MSFLQYGLCFYGGRTEKDGIDGGESADNRQKARKAVGRPKKRRRTNSMDQGGTEQNEAWIYKSCGDNAPD